MSERQLPHLSPLTKTALAAGAVAAAALAPHAPHNQNSSETSVSTAAPAPGLPDAAWPPVDTRPQPQLPKPSDIIVPKPHEQHHVTVTPPVEQPKPTPPQPQKHKPTKPAPPPKLPTPVRPPQPPHPPKNPEQPVELAPETWTVPGDVSTYMQENAAYLPSLGCSGALIRDANDQPIGVLTAAHCSLRGVKTSSTRFVGNDGQTYIVEPDGVEVDTGDALKSLETIGSVTNFLLPAADDISHDVALGAFGGHTTDEVLTAYKTNQFPEDQLPSLKLGDRMYLSGWPDDQPKAPTHERQEFPLAILGMDTAHVTNGEAVKVIWAAVAADKDGAMCSFGDSGGEGFIMQDGQPRVIGTLTAFSDFTGTLYGTPAEGESSRKAFEAAYGVDLKGIVAVCGFSYETPDQNETPVVAKVVPSTDDVPGYVDTISPQAQIDIAHKEAFDPTYQRTIVDGILPVYGDGGPLYIDRPMLFYSQDVGSVVVAWYDPSQPDSLMLDYIDNLDQLIFFKVAGQSDDPGLLTSTGAVTPDGDINGKMGPGFLDTNGLEFGQTLNPGLEPDTTSSYGVYASDTPNNASSQLVIYQRPEYGKGGGK